MLRGIGFNVVFYDDQVAIHVLGGVLQTKDQGRHPTPPRQIPSFFRIRETEVVTILDIPEIKLHVEPSINLGYT